MSVSLVFITGGINGWFIKSESNNFGATASVHKSYYESGDGLSPSTAFEIARPMQFYYFSWLQNLGYYNAAVGDQSAINAGRLPSPVYFRISQDLDMTGFTLPSVGTTENPFVGVLDGGGHAIRNLTVSNTENFNLITNPPVGASNVVGFQIVGVFGVVGKIKNTQVTFDASAAAVKNLVLSDVTVKTQDPLNDVSLIGVAAGYVNGELSNVTVAGGAISVGANILPLSAYTSAYSDFSLIGYCEENCKSQINLNFTEVYAPYVDSAYVPGSMAQGAGDNWGGSIDMKSLNLRLFDLLNSGNTVYSSGQYFGYYADEYQTISVGRGNNVQTYYTGNPTTTRIFYNLLGEGTHTYRNQNFNMPGTCVPLLVDENFRTLDVNTGYIVSGTESLSGVNGTIRSSSYETRFISNSLDDVNKTREQVYSGTGTTFPSYDKTKTEIITNAGANYSSGNFLLIKDELEGFNGNHTPTSASAVYGINKSDATTPTALGLTKYNPSRLSLDSLLYGENFIHGIHFVGSSISANNKVTMSNALINGVSYNNYELPTSSINFRVKEEGFINCFAGSYYSRTNSSWADSFFSLHEVVRNGNSIVSIREIKFIYENLDYDPNMPGSNKYVYRFDNQAIPTNAGNLVFDMRFLTEQPPVDNALYYFEIPVNSGEYALGTVSGKSGGGYLMYLDISASALQYDGEKTVETKTTVKYKYEYPDGINLSGVGTVPPAVLAETVVTTGDKTVTLATAQTDAYTALLMRKASHLQTAGNAIVVKLTGIEETVEQRVTVIETVNGVGSVYEIITVSIYNKDVNGNVLSVNTVCSAKKDGVEISVPTQYGGAVTTPPSSASNAVFGFRYVDYGGNVTSDYLYTEATGGGIVGTFAFTVISDEDITVIIESISSEYPTTVNGVTVSLGDEIDVSP